MGRALGRDLAEGDLVLISGGLGAGKTVFVQGIAEGLGVTDTVTSPTFTLMHVYQGETTLVHVDVYRLERTGEMADLALDELAEDAVVAVEWGDVVAAELPEQRIEVSITFGEGDDDRVVEVHRVG